MYKSVNPTPMISPKAVQTKISSTPFLPKKKHGSQKSFEFLEPSGNSKSVVLSKSTKSLHGHNRKIQELSDEINDIYEFRAMCFDRIRTLEVTIERNKHTYESEINYMQEYINLLKRKLGQGRRSADESTVCAGCEENRRINHGLVNDLEEMRNNLKLTEDEYESCYIELQSKQLEINQLLEKGKKHGDTGELLEAIRGLENKKENYEKKINELQMENVKVYELQMENQKLAMILRDKENSMQGLRSNQRFSEENDSVDELGKKLAKKVEETTRVCESKFYTVLEKSKSLEQETFRLSKIAKFLRSSLKKEKYSDSSQCSPSDKRQEVSPGRWILSGSREQHIMVQNSYKPDHQILETPDYDLLLSENYSKVNKNIQGQEISGKAITDLEELIDSLRKKIEELEADLKQARSKISDVQQAPESVEVFQWTRENKASKNNLLEKDQSSCEEQLIILDMQAKGISEGGIIQLQIQNQYIQEKCLFLEEEVKMLNDLNIKLHNENLLSDEIILRLKEENKNARELLPKLDSELVDMSNKFIDAEAMGQELVQEINNMQGKNKDLLKEVSSLLEKQEELEEICSKAKEDTNTANLLISSLTEELHILKENSEKFEIEIIASNRVISLLHQEINQFKNTQYEVEEDKINSERLILELQTEINELQESKLEAEAAIDNSNKALSELKEQNSSVLAIKDKAEENLSSANQSILKLKEELYLLIESNTKVEEEKINLHQSLAVLTDKLNELDEKNKEYELEMNSINQSLVEANNRVIELHERNRESGEDKISSDLIISELKQEIVSSKNKISKMERESQSLNEAINSLNENKRNSEEDIISSNRLICVLKEEIGSLTEDLIKKSEEISAITNTNSELEGDKNSLNHLIENFEKENEILVKKCRGLEEDLISLKAHIEDTDYDRKCLSHLLSDLKEENEYLSKKLQKTPVLNEKNADPDICSEVLLSEFRPDRELSEISEKQDKDKCQKAEENTLFTSDAILSLKQELDSLKQEIDSLNQELRSQSEHLAAVIQRNAKLED